MARTGRPKAALTVTDDERAELERLTKRVRTNRDLSFRARIVSACVDEPLNKAVARRLHCNTATVGKWRDIARDTAWKDYGAKTATAAKLLKLATDVAA